MGEWRSGQEDGAVHGQEDCIAVRRMVQLSVVIKIYNGAVVGRMVLWSGGWCCEGDSSVSDVLSSHSDHVILCLFAGTPHSILLQPFSEQRGLHFGDLCIYFFMSMYMPSFTKKLTLLNISPLTPVT